MNNKNKDFSAMLDARATFDKINIYGMLSKLIKLKVYFNIIHCLFKLA